MSKRSLKASPPELHPLISTQEAHSHRSNADALAQRIHGDYLATAKSELGGLLAAVQVREGDAPL